MTYPGSQPEAAFVSGADADAVQPWDCTHPAPPLSLLGQGSEGNLQLDGVAHPDPNWAHNPPACTSQVQTPGASCVTHEAELMSGFLMNPLSTQHTFAGCESGPVGPAAGANWTGPAFSAIPSLDVACHPPQQPVSGDPVGPIALQPQNLPYGSFLGSAGPSTTALAQWIAPAWGTADTTGLSHVRLLSHHGFDTTLETSGHEGASLSSMSSNPSPWPEPHPLSPGCTLNHNSINNYYRQHSSMLLADVALRNVATLESLAGPQRSKPEHTPPSKPLAIIQYNPNGDTEPKASRKKLALEEVTPQGLASRTLRHISLQDAHGKVKGAMMTFGKRVKTRTALNEEKRRRTALARREGVCSRCKNSKRQVGPYRARRAVSRRINSLTAVTYFSVTLLTSQAFTSAAPSVLAPNFTRTPLDCPVSRPAW
jgi:hypothetical protein